MYLKPACSVLSSSPFCVRARLAMLVQRCARLDDVVHLAAHLLLELRDVVRVVRIPERQRHAAGVCGELGIVLPQFLLRRRLVVVREVAQEEEGQHVVAEIVRIHRPAQLVGDVPEGLAQLFLVLCRSWWWFRCWALRVWVLERCELRRVCSKCPAGRTEMCDEVPQDAAKSSLLSSPISVGSWMAYLPWLRRLRARL